MDALNLPAHPFKVVEDSGKLKIFDPVRRKYLVLTPEEWVRQHFVQFLINERGFPAGLFKLESAVKHNQRVGRYDLTVFNNQGQPLVLVECKAPSVKITKETFYQIAKYNSAMNLSFLMITNGLDHYFVDIDVVKNKMSVSRDIPQYDYLVEKY